MDCYCYFFGSMDLCFFFLLRGLEEDSKRIGGGSEEDWGRIGGGLEEDWRSSKDVDHNP